MSDISELEGRLTDALDRISRGVAAIKAAPAEIVIDTEEQDRLTAENDELRARVERLEQRALRLTDRLEDVETENARCQEVITTLHDHCDALTAANSAGQGAGEAINAALATQIAELRATQKADIAQMDEILAELAPALKEA
ncbi:MAG: hypothetical protein ABJ327_15110 [Litoreibacter sp.]